MNFEMLELDLVYSRPCKLKISFGEHEEFIIEFDEFGTLSKQEPSDAFVFLIAYKLDIRDCINHVLEVYKISKLHTLKVIGAINNPQNLLKIIGKLDLKVLWIFFNFSENSTTISVYREILNHLGARCDVVSIYNLSIDISIQYLLSRDWNYINLAPYQPISADYLLSLNSRKFSSGKALSSKEVNIFLRHWIRGSHPNLEYIKLSVNAVDREIIFKNVPYYLAD